MNILHLRASNFYGGPERQLHFHARLAKDSPYKVTVASFAESGGRPEFLDVIARDNIPVHVFDVTSAYDTRAISDLRNYCRANEIDILCTHDYRTTVLGCMAARRIRTRWLAFSRGFTQDNLKVRLYHAIDKFLIRQANHIVAVSHSQKDKLRRLWIREKNISVVHNAIDPDSFAAIPPVDLRTRFGFEPDTFVCISGGRFSREKGQAHLVEAAWSAIARNPRLRFVLFGDGPDWQRMRGRAETLGLVGKVLCPGFERNLLGCMKGADMLINPSLSEGLPNIVLEAMALGVPVVATSVGGVPELVTDNQSGKLVPAANASAMADAIVELADNAEKRAALVSSAKDAIAGEFSFAAQFKMLAALYDRFGGRGGA